MTNYKPFILNSKQLSNIPRITLIGIAIVFLLFFLLLPLVVVFSEAFSQGSSQYFAALNDPDTKAAIWLSLITASIAVPVNLFFGIMVAWLVTKFSFPGRNILLTLFDLPLSVSPVIAGMIFILLYGSKGLLGPLLENLGFKLIFATPGIVIATTFITIPYIAREIIPLMQEQGTIEEEAALTLGASGRQTFFLVTLPNIKWALIYGLILCNARALGEFGAVSVVSGHIRGLTNTLPLQVEVLYNEYNFTAAFTAASLLALLAIITLTLKTLVEWHIKNKQRKN